MTRAGFTIFRQKVPSCQCPLAGIYTVAVHCCTIWHCTALSCSIQSALKTRDNIIIFMAHVENEFVYKLGLSSLPFPNQSVAKGDQIMRQAPLPLPSCHSFGERRAGRRRERSTRADSPRLQRQRSGLLPKEQNKNIDTADVDTAMIM